MNDARGSAVDGGGGGSRGGGEDYYEMGENNYYASQESGHSPSPSATVNGTPYDAPGVEGKSEGGGEYLALMGADAPSGGPSEEGTAAPEDQSSQPSTGSQALWGGGRAGGGGSGTRGGPSGGGSRSSSSGDNIGVSGSSVDDHTTADELSQWSLEKLREVSKVKVFPAVC